ncbi:MBL fold metallo-hydrolase [Phenylobacterium sp.]|uniref:MBL fold metallo-hydrolase n=1 Tax=Phenylobacterium sp. TaxID=1871053 RepID=UPI0025E2445B|nr:MBL fold metallo-hydrolase [Phenylobacterium sp.]
MSSKFIVLGTNAGPVPNPARAEPANVLRYGPDALLIDAGDGAAWQLAKAGVGLGEIRTVFISHLHFDHTGGLFAFLSQRYQGLNAGEVTIYGPPGIGRTVDGLLAAMGPMTEPGTNVRARHPKAPQDMVRVVEIADGRQVSIGAIKVTAATNSHYSLGGDATENKSTSSFAFRFDLPDRSIVYTGDTGPSPRVAALAKDVDLLVAEVMDPVAAIDEARRRRPDIPASALKLVEQHFRLQHLAPQEVGRLAQEARAKSLVLTHSSIVQDQEPAARQAISAEYAGKVTFAVDLQVF